MNSVNIPDTTRWVHSRYSETKTITVIFMVDPVFEIQQCSAVTCRTQVI